MRIPLFVWAMETYAILLVLTLPVVTAAVTLLLFDRQAWTNFFLPEEGGSALLYQHMFWFFGHPEVYVMILPAFGMVSEIIPVFARKPIFGYKAIAFSTIGIAFAGMLVWAHHMFTVGLPGLAERLLRRRLAGGRDPDVDQDLQLARDALARPPRVQGAAALLPRPDRALHDRRALRDHARDVPDRLPGARLLLRRRAHALRALRRNRVRAVRGRLLLVPEDHRPDVQRAPGPVALLAHLHRLQPDLLLPAHGRAHGDAAPRSTPTTGSARSSSTTCSRRSAPGSWPSRSSSSSTT